jgi:hypothetical protein
MKVNKYLLIVFVGLAVAMLIILTNQQREGFNLPGGMKFPGGGMDMCALQLAGVNQRITNLENRANDAQDNTNTGVGAIQMVARS